MSLHGPARHLELAGNFSIVTALQEQLDNLLFARTQPNGLLRHRFPQGSGFASALGPWHSWEVSKLCSIHNASLRRKWL
jgi:hypothetical protein